MSSIGTVNGNSINKFPWLESDAYIYTWTYTKCIQQIQNIPNKSCSYYQLHIHISEYDMDINQLHIHISEYDMDINQLHIHISEYDMDINQLHIHISEYDIDINQAAALSIGTATCTHKEYSYMHW